MDQLPGEIGEMKAAVAELARSLGVPVGNGNAVSTINVNAGGVGVLVMCVLVALMAGMVLVGSAQLNALQTEVAVARSDFDRKISELRAEHDERISANAAYITAVYRGNNKEPQK